jgi:DNA (cytosine-5)-methyltransferase 1
MNELALFSGGGGGILGGHLLGWRTICAVELDAHCRKSLLARQRDQVLEPFPIWDNVLTFDGRPWAGHVDVVSGGFPCTDISCAGRGEGISGPESSLWKEMARIIGEVGPRFAFVENSSMLAGRGLDVVLGDLATLGYDAEWLVLGAGDVGAPHKRERIWILAHAKGERSKRRGLPIRSWRPLETQVYPEGSSEDVSHASLSGRIAPRHQTHGHNPPEGGSGASQPIGIRPGIHQANVANAPGICERKQANKTDTVSTRWQARDESVDLGDAGDPNSQRLAQREGIPSHDGPEQPTAIGADWGPVESGLGRVADGLGSGLERPWAAEPAGVPRVAPGVPNRVARLRAIGNGQVPLCAAVAFQLLYTRIMEG